MSDPTVTIGQSPLSMEPVSADRRRRAGANWRLFAESRYGPVGLGAMALIALAAVFAPILSPADPFAIGSAPLLEPLTTGHPLGTDHLGRDVLAQILYGARLSLAVGLIAALIAGLLGVAIGAISGFFGGWLDLVLSRITDMFLIFPTFFLIIVVVATFGSNVYYVMIIIGLTSWPANARLMRAQALALRERTFIRALTALGESRPRIMLRHIVPNGVQPVIANSSLVIAGAILTEAGLSFLGLGDPNQASWGRMIYDGRSYLTTAWWTSIFAGVATVVTVMAFYLIGDGLSYMLNPKGRRSGR